MKIKALILILLATSLSACLKTRAQVRQEQGGEEQSEEGAAPAAGKAPSYALDEVKTEITQLGGRVEVLEHTQQTANLPGLRESVNKLQLQTADIEKNQVLIMEELKALKDAANQEKTHAEETARVKANPRDALSNAYGLLETKNYEGAAEAFQKVIGAKPSNKDSVEAHFGLGSAQYHLKDYKKAIVTLSKVQELSAKSPRVPSSLYLIGRSFDKLNMKKEAAGFYSELTERFPKSVEGKKVRGAKN